jgi:cytochrome b561
MASIAAASAAYGRYGRVSIALHWTLAALIVVQLCLGWYMNEVLPDHSAAQAQVVTIHVWVGLTILILVLARIGVRIGHPAPPLPPAMPRWEAALARATHVMLYMLMLGLPLTGWAIASSRKGGVTFWGLPWPSLPGLHSLARPARHALSHAHVFVLIWILLVMLFMHVAGAIWHQFDGNFVLWRMGLGRRPRGA